MVEYVTHSQIKIDRGLYNFINDDAILGSDIDVDMFWNGFSELINDLAPINRQLIERREELQSLLDEWHCSNRDNGIDYGNHGFFEMYGCLLIDNHWTGTNKARFFIKRASVCHHRGNDRLGLIS